MLLASRRLLLAAPALLVAACAERRAGDGTPAFYRDLTRPGAPLDHGMAATMINGHRQNNGLGPVAVDARLGSVAQDMAAAMARADDVSVSLRQPALRERLQRRGYPSTAAEENVSAGYRTLAEAFSMWRGSRPHDRVMRLQPASHLGIAAVQAPGSRFGVYWALVMANAAA